MLIDVDHSTISIARQCDLLGLSRSSYYYQYAQSNDATEKLMRFIDERYTEYPFEGSRRISIWLQRNGHAVSRDQVRYLMRKMGLKAIYPKPNTSAKSRFEHVIYPYLLNKVCVYYPNQVWCSDITYIRMKHGHIYLMAIMDWYSRYVIDWELSTTLEADFCVETLNRSLRKSCCGIFNTDQGAQFTSNKWIKTLISNDVTISMDGRGRCFDNIFIERLWRSVKYECIFLKEFETITEVRDALIRYFEYYNTDRYHQKLENFTPAEVYFCEVELEEMFKKTTSIIL
jgi:putative transposase